MTMRDALVLGATGLVGGHCLDLLLGDDSYSKVITLGRRVVPRREAKLEQHVIAFERAPEFAHLVRAKDVFCCLGTTLKKAGSKEKFYETDFTYPYELASIAARNGTEQLLLVSSLGADAGSSVFYSRVKGELEEAVTKLPFKGVQIFRPSLLLGKREEFRLGERIAERLSAPLSFLLAGPFGKYRPISARAVAQAMINIAKKDPPGVNIFESDRIRTLSVSSSVS